MTASHDNVPVIGKKNYPHICEESLIEQVQQHPHLYDIHAIDYKDSKKCVSTWLAIAKELGLPAGEWKMCKERWRTLRDVYVRNRRSIKEGEGFRKRPRWRFFDKMDFLTPYVNHRTTESDMQPSVDTSRLLLANGETIMYEDDSDADCHEAMQDDPISTQDSDSNPPITLVDGRPIKEEVEWAEEEMEAIERLEPLLTQELMPDKPPPAKKLLKSDKMVVPQLDNNHPLVLKLHLLNTASGQAMLGGKKLRMLLPASVNPVNHRPIQIKTKTGCNIRPKPVHSQPKQRDGGKRSSSSSNNNNNSSSSSSQAPPPPLHRVPVLPHKREATATDTSERVTMAVKIPPVNVVQEPRPSTEISDGQIDEEELFGRYIAASMRKLTDRSKSLVKMRIQQVLFYLQESDRGIEQEQKVQCAFDEKMFE